MGKAFECEICKNLFPGEGEVFTTTAVEQIARTKYERYNIFVKVTYKKSSINVYNEAENAIPTEDICRKCQAKLLEIYLSHLKASL